jgi:two-component system LytT family sensor kinase
MSRALTLRSKPTQYPSFAILFVGWTALGLLAYTRFALLGAAPNNKVVPELIGWLTCYYPWLVLTPLVFRLEGRYPLGRHTAAKNVVVLALAGLALAYLANKLTLLLNVTVAYVFRESFAPSRFAWSIPRSEFGLEQALYWFTVGIGCLVRHVMDLREKERLAAQLTLEKLQLENSLRRAELETLRARLNPHFLFNCLQNISTLSQRDSKLAGQMLARLGDLLRVALKRDAEVESTLEEEVSLVQAYVSIETMRFAGRLNVLFDIASETERALVPTFLLQPLVENAITHGLRGDQKAGAIRIQTNQQADELVVTVSDNGAGISNEQLADLEVGIGLGSTCERLTRMYPERHTFSIQRLSEGGTEVRISLPLRWKKGSDETSHENAAIVDRR